MVFRCPTCGRFVKASLIEGKSEFGTCYKCRIHYFARFTGCITESGNYDTWLTVWPSPDQTRGKKAMWNLKVS